MIKKNLFQVKKILLVGSNVGARASFVWEETRVPRENPYD